MVRAFIKRLVIWLFLSMPVGIVIGGAFSAFVPEDAAVDRRTSVVNGARAGAGLALIGAWVAAGTTAITRGTLKRVGGSEFMTGAIISYGVVIAGLLLLEFA
ncbi:MAG: hypothetical protein V3S98_07060 [Dehalococcoidia bacterium]